MSILAVTYPVQAAIPVAHTFLHTAMTVARPLFGIGMLMILIMMFKPLGTGIFQAVGMIFRPRQSLEERNSRRTLRGVMELNSLAREMDQSQPNQAAELRLLASRG